MIASISSCSKRSQSVTRAENICFGFTLGEPSTVDPSRTSEPRAALCGLFDIVRFMNHLASLVTLHNRYYLMRHGESKANAEDKIISHPSNALGDLYGLTGLGRQQVIEAAKNSKLTSETIIYTSDYMRAKESAELVSQTLNAQVMHISTDLRERDFGEWEGKPTANYEAIWQNDSEAKDNTGVESPDEILDRTTKLITEIEAEYKDRQVLLVAHGDTLQILQCGFNKVSPTRHRNLSHLGIAEIRRAELKIN
jgi:broad specificity phosphatase PhoE